jgi:hypothetical protein
MRGAIANETANAALRGAVQGIAHRSESAGALMQEIATAQPDSSTPQFSKTDFPFISLCSQLAS